MVQDSEIWKTDLHKERRVFKKEKGVREAHTRQTHIVSTGGKRKLRLIREAKKKSLS